MQIAKLNAMLTATATQFKSVFASAGKTVLNFGTDVARSAAKIGAIGAGFGAAAVVGIGALVKSSMDSIDTLKDQAESIGVTTDALSRLQYAASFAGIENETLSGSLVKMIKNIDDAAAGGGSAAAALKTLGLDAKQLSSVSADQQMLAVAEALKKVENSGQKAGLAVDIFGKQGAALIPVLNGGAEGLQKMFAESDALGNTVKQVDAAKVEAAADAMQRVGVMISGIGKVLAVELAPYIAAAANSIVGMGTSGEGMGARVVSAVEFVAKAVAYASDYLELFEVAWNVVKIAATTALMGIVTGPIQVLAQGVDWLLDKLGMAGTGVGEFMKQVNTELATDMMRNADAAAEATKRFSDGASSKAVGKFFDEVRRNAQTAAEASTKVGDAGRNIARTVTEDTTKVSEAIDKLKKQVDEFGKSDADKLANSLREMGATDAQIGEATALQKQLDEMEALKKAHEDMASEAKKVWEETRTPAEKYEEQIASLQKMLDGGAIDQSTFDRASAKAKSDLDADKAKSKSDDSTGPQLLAQGSAEAARFISQFQNRQRGNDPQTQVVKNTNRANGYLSEIARALSGGATDEAVFFN